MRSSTLMPLGFALASLIFASLTPSSAAQATKEKKDPFPKGCVSCHAKVPDGDHRLNVMLSKAKHPNLAAVKNVPSDCLRCHKPAAKKPTFGEMVHKQHFGRGAASVFVQKFAGDCAHCHDMNQTTGKVTNKSGAKNW